jgi:hypothetical protein
VTRITGDDFMLIGLHKMASERGDGLIPEMMEALRRGRENPFDDPGAVRHGFPLRGTGPEAPAQASNENNVIAFPLMRRRAERRR